MGKIKRERPKYHLAAAEKQENEIKPAKNLNKKYKPQLNLMQNIFAGINIQLSGINTLDESPKPAVTQQKEVHIEKSPIEPKLESDLISTNSKRVSTGLDSKLLTKKEKLILKRKKLMEKLDATHRAKNELQKRHQNPKRKNDFNQQVLLKSQGELRPMLTPAATKSSNQKQDEQAVKNVFSIPSFRDGLPALNSVFGSRKDVLRAQRNPTISKQKHGQKSFGKNFNYLKKSMAKKMK